MRIEELSEGRYLKQTDNVEKYLLGLIEDYFKTVNYTAPSSKEYIIEQAVRRLKEEVDFDALGVLSISLPDDVEPRTGAVNISIQDLHGEPEILDKKSAFNVPFGVLANTACEGNDERLSNPREPLPHQHRVEDIPGLQGIITTLDEKANKLDQNRHSHDNKSVLDLLKYTGNQESIDLAILDDLDSEMIDLVASVIDEINGYKSDANTKIQEVNQKIQEINTKINELHDFVVSENERNLTLAKEYADTKSQEILDSVTGIISECVTKQDFKNILAMMNNTYIFAGEDSINIQEFFDIFNFKIIGQNESSITNQYTISISSEIMSFITANEQELRDCIFEPYIEYQGFCQQAPISFNKELKEDGFISVDLDVDAAKCIINVSSRSMQLPTYLNNCTIKYKIFCKPKIEYSVDEEESGQGE